MNIDLQRDPEGYLVNPEEWNEDIAMQLANEEEISLNDTYWLILKFMRQYYHEHSIAPDVRHVSSFISKELECSKSDAKKMIFELFPYGYVKQACKISGMKKPRAWSTG